MMTNVDGVIRFHGVEPRHLKLNDDEIEELRSFIAEWIIQAQDLIVSYTHNKSLMKDTPPSVTSVCNRIVSRMIDLAIAKRDSPIIEVDDWKVTTISDEIFSDALKNDLEPFCKDYSNHSRNVEFFAITGE